MFSLLSWITKSLLIKEAEHVGRPLPNAYDLIAQNKVSNKTVVTALAQSSGRGKYKRTWVSHHGNLYASFIYKDLEREAQIPNIKISKIRIQ